MHAPALMDDGTAAARTELPPGSSRDAVTAGLRAMGLTAGAMIIPLAQAPLVGVDLSVHGSLQPATCLVILAEALVLLALWLRARQTVLMWTTGALLLTAAVWWMPTRVHLEGLNWWAPGFWAIPWVCWAVTLVTRRTFVAINALALGLLTILDPLTLWLDGIQVTALRLVPVPWFTMPVAMMALFGYGLDILARQADHQIARRLRAERSQEQERTEGDATREAARLLHDHVLHALHAISRGASGQVPHAMIVDECRTAVDAIDRARDPQATVQLEQLLSEDPALGPCGAKVFGQASPIPREVAHAMAAAAHEALTNVAKHAQARHVHVEVSERGSQWHVHVRDDGRGFDTERLPSHGRLGLVHSVHERLEDAGGSSRVVSAPGRGTTVHLVWPAVEDQSSTIAWPRLGNRYLGRILARTSWPALAITPFMMVLAGSLVEPSWPLRLVAGGLLLLGLWWLRRLRDHEMTWRGQASILIVTTLAWWLNLYLAPQDLPTVYPLWIGWTAAGLVHLAVLQVPLARGVTVLALWSVVQTTALALTVGWDRLFHVSTSLSTGIAEGLIALVALHVAQGVMDQNTTQARVTEALRRSASQMHARTHVEQYWSKRVTDVALPLLRTVADGRRELGCASLSAQASRLEATLRDELVLGPGHEDFLDALGRLRQSGWTVRSTLGDEYGADALARLGMVLDHAGEPMAPGQTVTLSGTASQLVALVVAPSPAQCERWSSLAAECGMCCDVDPDFVRVSVPVHTGEQPA